MAKRREIQRGVDAYQVRMGREKLVVISLPAESRARKARILTSAERMVVSLAVRGLANAEIAARRRSSPRTVANQLASVYRKLGVSSRAELAAKVLR